MAVPKSEVNSRRQPRTSRSAARSSADKTALRSTQRHSCRSPPDRLPSRDLPRVQREYRRSANPIRRPPARRANRRERRGCEPRGPAARPTKTAAPTRSGSRVRERRAIARKRTVLPDLVGAGLERCDDEGVGDAMVPYPPREQGQTQRSRHHEGNRELPAVLTTHEHGDRGGKGRKQQPTRSNECA